MSDVTHFLNAVRFLTVMPVPASDNATEPDWLARSMRYFPLVGIGIGTVSAIVLLIAGQIWGPIISALLAVTASIAITGALHEDGLADTADAFGGGWSIEKRLAIMKDSRIGTYGALALGLGVALRVTTLSELPLWTGAAALIAAHAAARWILALIVGKMTYAGDTAAMKVGYSDVSLRIGDAIFAGITVAIAAAPLTLLSTSPLAIEFIGGIIGGGVLAALLAMLARRLIGGYTGDVLGAVEQLFEIGFLLGVAAVIR